MADEKTLSLQKKQQAIGKIWIAFVNQIFSNIILFFVVVDAYAKWCGPCKAVESTFRRIRNESGDDLLHFAMVSYEQLAKNCLKGTVEIGHIGNKVIK